MAITISGENNNDRILAADGVLDSISGINATGIVTATSFTGDLTGNVTGNLTGNVNSTSPLLLQTGGSERFRITGNNELGIAGANYGSSGQVLTSGGSGSAVSWTTIPTQVTIANNGNDRIITGGSGTNLNGEANLQFDGTNLFMPSELRHLGDPDTKMGFDTDTIKFETAGSERLRIDSSGRVIIGKVMTAGSGSHYDDITINNSNQSGTAGSTGIDLISSNDAYGGLIFSDEDAHEQGYIKYWHASDADKMRFGTNSNDRWEISKDGHWIPASDSSYDIGTNATRVRYLYTDNFYATSLSYDGNKLKFGGGTRALDNGYYDDIVIDNSDSTSGEAGGSGISIISGNTSWGGLIFGDNDHHQRGYIKYAHEFEYMQLVTASGSGQVRILSNGSVNIGGDYDQNTYNLSVTHSSNFLRLKDSNEGNYDLRFMIQNSEANIWHYGTDDFVFGNRYDRKLSFITNGQKRLTIHGNNIGINDTSPSYTLNVIGDNAASNGIGMLKGIIGVQNDTTAYGSYPTAGISFQTKYRTGPDVPLDVAAIYGGKENTTNGDKDGYMGFAVREEPGSGTQERMRITSEGHVLFSGLTTKNDPRNVNGITLKSTAGVSFQNFGANGSRNWRIRPDDQSRWGDLDFSVSPTANSATDWPDAASDKVLTLGYDGTVTKPRQPLFVVQKSGAITGTGFQIFNTVIENIGSHYNSSNGKFTAPVAGYYYFIVKINAYKRIDFYISRNGSVSGNTNREIGQFNTSNQDGWYSHNLVRIFELSANDYVMPYVSNLYQNTDPGEWLTFQGYLIQ